jgi:pyridoxal phosphate enzyme (YggS family)
MAFLISNFKSLLKELPENDVTLVAVSKTKPEEDILEAYNNGVLDFGENYVQELLAKHEALPKDIRWHFIGHLQSNKVKYIIPFVHLIHGIDSEKLLAEIDKQAAKAGQRVSCLLQVHIAEEETKFGFDEKELRAIIPAAYKNVNIAGLMGMASFSDDQNKVRNEFKKLKMLFDQLKTIYPAFTILSMGMSSDYKLAIDEGSNMVRIGSLLFGERN